LNQRIPAEAKQQHQQARNIPVKHQLLRMERAFQNFCKSAHDGKTRRSDQHVNNSPVFTVG
jgi:hypothetical protein